jgi:hypothetical protein
MKMMIGVIVLVLGTITAMAGDTDRNGETFKRAARPFESSFLRRALACIFGRARDDHLGPDDVLDERARGHLTSRLFGVEGQKRTIHIVGRKRPR